MAQAKRKRMEQKKVKKMFVKGIAVLASVFMLSAPVCAAEFIGYYPVNEAAVSETRDNDRDVSTFMSYDRIVFRGSVTIERNMAYDGRSQIWEFQSIGGDTTNFATLTVGNTIALTNGAAIEIVPGFTVPDSSNLTDDTENINVTAATEVTNYNNVIEFINVYQLPDMEGIENLFVLSEENRNNGWSMTFTPNSNGTKVTAISLSYTPTPAEEDPSEEVTSGDVEIDDGGSSGGCNAGFTSLLLLAVMGSGFMCRNKK